MGYFNHLSQSYSDAISYHLPTDLHNEAQKKKIFFTLTTHKSLHPPWQLWIALTPNQAWLFLLNDNLGHCCVLKSPHTSSLFGRESISKLPWGVSAFVSHYGIFSLFFLLTPPSPPHPIPTTIAGGYGRVGGLTNERHPTDHVIWGPMRGLKKSHGKGTYKIHTYKIWSDIATTRPNRPSGPIRWKYI